MRLPDQVTADLERHVERVARASPQQAARAGAASNAVGDLVQVLGLDGYLGMVREDNKPRVLLRFSSSSVPSLKDARAGLVLKVYGDRVRGEGPLLKEWQARGIPVPLIEAGELLSSSWLLMEYLPGYSQGHDDQDWLKVTDAIAQIAVRMHQSFDLDPDYLRPLSSVMLPRWRACAEALIWRGHRIPKHWEAAATRAYGSGPPVSLHGDLATSNIVLVEQRGPMVLDASALLGPAPFDAARWCARLAAHTVSPLVAHERWLSWENLDRNLADLMLGVECVLEAGSLEIVRSGRGEGTRPPIDRTAYGQVIDDLVLIAQRIL